MVTAAALVMSISFAALIAAQVSFMRMFGVGLTLAVLVDATLVRMMLVPAFMHVLGRANWWAPKPLARLHERFGISEASTPQPTEAAPKETGQRVRISFPNPIRRRQVPRGSGELLRDEILDAATELLPETESPNHSAAARVVSR